MRIFAIASCLSLAACSSGGSEQPIQDDPAPVLDFVQDGSERLQDAFLAGDVWSCQAVRYNQSGTISEYIGRGAHFAYSVDVDNELFYLYTEYEQIATTYSNTDSFRETDEYGSWHIHNTTLARPIDLESVLYRSFRTDGSIRITGLDLEYSCGRLPYADVRLYDRALP